jgi:glycosyltransferase involved in cell wall biosynthesis
VNSLVSVIIPAHNSEKYIQETINSVLQQTWRPIEIIVIDDGSTDNTLSLLNQFHEPFIEVYSQKNKGACSARNLGLKYAQGEFIQFLDADDLLAPDKIELQMNQLLSFSNYSNKIIHCQWGRFYKSIYEKIRWEPHDSIRRELSPADWLIADKMSNTHCWLVHRNLIDQSGAWDESLERNQDGEFFSRLVSNAESVLFCSEAKVYYRSGLASSIAGNHSKSASLSALKVIDLISGYVLSLENSKRARLCVANKYMSFAFSNFIMYPALTHIAELKAAELGGSNLKLEGGRILKMLSSFFGWKWALLIKRVANSISNLLIK